jgi:diguanylate cyclase (GGDEF)-like protein
LTIGNHYGEAFVLQPLGAPVSLWKTVFRPDIPDKASLRRYVISVTLLSWLVAICVDVANQMAFFTTWADAWREWAITTAVAAAIAIPIARSMGRAHLALHHLKAEAERLSRTDPLTGLANRRAFYEAAKYLSGGALTLAIADIDRFKRVNDRYGHAAGDEFIKAVAARMQAELGEMGLVARLGGEEFALIAARRPDAEVRGRLQQFRQHIADEPVPFAEQSLCATISIGFAARSDFDFDSLYRAADTALYVAKSAGRNRVVDFDQIGELASGATAAKLRVS